MGTWELEAGSCGRRTALQNCFAELLCRWTQRQAAPSQASMLLRDSFARRDVETMGMDDMGPGLDSRAAQRWSDSRGDRGTMSRQNGLTEQRTVPVAPHSEQR